MWKSGSIEQSLDGSENWVPAVVGEEWVSDFGAILDFPAAVDGGGGWPWPVGQKMEKICCFGSVNVYIWKKNKRKEMSKLHETPNMTQL